MKTLMHIFSKAILVCCAILLAASCGCSSITGNQRDASRSSVGLSTRQVEGALRSIDKKLSHAKSDTERGNIAREGLDSLSSLIPVDLDDQAVARLSSVRLRLNQIVLRSDCMIAINDARASIESEGAIDAKIERAETAVLTLDTCVAAGIMDKADECAFRAARRELKRFAVENMHELYLRLACEAFQAARTPEEAMLALNGAICVIDKSAREDVWSSGELEILNAQSMAIRRKAQELTEQRDAIAKRCDEWVSQQQSLFVNRGAVDDLEDANRAIAGERGKRFNWRVLGYFRDNVQIVANSLLLCDRVRQDGRVEYALRAKASDLRNSTWKRLSNGEKSDFGGLPQMTGYDGMPGFPRLSKEKKEALVAEDWRRQRETTPIVEPTDVGPMNVGPMNNEVSAIRRKEGAIQ